MLKKAIIKSVAFILLLTCCLYFTGLVLKPKRVNYQPDVTAKVRGFYNEPDNSLDVVFCGTSKMFCLINPNQLWHEYGFTSYDFATNEQPIWVTYYFVKELLKTQKPDLVVIDAYFAVYGEKTLSEPVLRSALDDLNLSANKIEAAWDNDEHKDILTHILPFFRYHDRWSKLTHDDYSLAGYDEKNPLRGYTPMYAIREFERPQVSDVTAVSPVPARAEEYLGKIINLLEEKGVNYMLLNTPLVISREQQEKYNYVEKYAEKHGIKYLDCDKYFDEIGLDFSEDYFDLVHTNVKGAKKVTAFLGKYLHENFELPDHRGDTNYAGWDTSYEYWTKLNEEKMPTFGTEEAEKELEGVLRQ